MVKQLMKGIECLLPLTPRQSNVLNQEAAQFLHKLHKHFEPRRKEILDARANVQKAIQDGKGLSFHQETEEIRNNPNWSVAKPPKDLEKRWVEITGPTDKKMLINALNSGADVYMADFEDSNSPVWDNMIEGQANLIDAVNRTLEFKNPEGKHYKLKENLSVLVVRPRGWHLIEKHFLVEGTPIAGALFDFGLFFFHNAKKLLEKGSGPYFYLPKMEHYLEARLWNDIFTFAQNELGIKHGSIKATVLIETIPAAFCMEEILYELRDHCAGLNAGRWDYIFSVIKKFRGRKDFLLPDRSQIVMTVPFMKAYTTLLIHTCHKRKAHAIGGMAAFIPSRTDKKINEEAIKKVREDKIREVEEGCDGTWVAHPDLVPIAREIFESHLKGKDNQKDRKLPESKVSAADLQNFTVPEGEITEQGFRQNINVGLQYIESWLRGVGAAAINNLMEDVATAEISRAQLWQWMHHDAYLKDGRKITAQLFKQIRDEEIEKIKKAWGEQKVKASRLHDASHILEKISLDQSFPEFLTLIAYEYLK